MSLAERSSGIGSKITDKEFLKKVGIGAAVLAGGLALGRIAKPRAVSQLLKESMTLGPRGRRTAINVAGEVVLTPQKYLDSVKGIHMDKYMESLGETRYKGNLEHYPFTLHDKPKPIIGTPFKSVGMSRSTPKTEMGEHMLPEVFIHPAAPADTYTHEMTHALQSAIPEDFQKRNIIRDLKKQHDLEGLLYQTFGADIPFDYHPYLPREAHVYKITGIEKEWLERIGRGRDLRPVSNPQQRKVWHPSYKDRFIKALKQASDPSEVEAYNFISDIYGEEKLHKLLDIYNMYLKKRRVRPVLKGR